MSQHVVSDFGQRNFSFLRSKEVCARRGLSSSTHYQDITDGLWTKPVKVGPRASAWPDFEVDLINAARVAGQSDDEIRDLVRRLEDARPHLVEFCLKRLAL